jgi:hypothetical protein
MLTCGFYEVEDAGGFWKDHIIRKMTNRYGWTHGKVFNMDNFWNKFGVHFRKDMKSHEDIFISSYIQCVFEFLGTSPMVTDEPFYIWFKHPGSLTMIDYLYDGKPHFFLEVLFKDYIASTAGVFLEQYEIGNISYDSFRESLLSCTLYIYFYMQSFMFHHPDDWIKENIMYARKNLLAFKKASHLTNDDIYNLVQMDDGKMYTEVSKSADMGAGNYIPTYGFRQWLDILSPEKEKLFLIKEET